MINIRLLQPLDVGRGVVYRPQHDHGNAEDGVITSWSDRFIFVRYRGSETCRATHPLDLTWLDDVGAP